MGFDLKEAIKVANQVLSVKSGRNLTDVEILVLTGAWNREEYDQIAAKHQYATSYISQDVAPKLWKTLSDALGERVKKSNFKEALKRYWDTYLALPPGPGRQPQPSAPRVTALEQLPAPPPTVDRDRYVARPPLETICYETLLQPGSLVRIKAPTLMGKTFLINRILAQIASQNYRTASLSFELADRKIHFTDLDRFLRWFCSLLSRELGLANQIEEYWDEAGMGSKVSCTTYVEDYLLTESDRPLVVCLDDVDLLFPFPEVYEDFFGLLRSWYEKARTRPNWKKLRLVIVHATDVYIRLNINQSPFNVGVPIELAEFTPEQVRRFAQQHGFPETTPLVEPLMQLVGGHPYLLEQALVHFKTHAELSLAEFLASAATDSGIYAGHLREHWLNLQEHPSLATAFQTIISAHRPVPLEPMQAYQLQSMGLVRLTGNQAEPRCQLYRQYFRSRLGFAP